MARLSKGNAFVAQHVQDASNCDSTGEAVHSLHSSEAVSSDPTCHGTIIHRDGEQCGLLLSLDKGDRRESKQSTISILPESPSWEHDEQLTQFVTNGPLIMRPSFIRPEVVQRMQMGSPPPLDLKDYAASYPHSVPGHGFPAQREHRSVSSTSSASSGSDVDALRYPLVLLHVTLLPLRLPWDSDVMRELLSPKTMSDLSLLRSKLTATIVQRGVLVPHPHEEYDLLEDRLLEALDLEPERLSSDGHFRSPYAQQDCAPSVVKPPFGSDSGLGPPGDSTSEELEIEGGQCKTCQRDFSSDTRWDIKVYAANGLMRAAAWTAVWRDMERVDVEISPRLSEEMTQQLHERQTRADTLREETFRDKGKTLSSTTPDAPCHVHPLTSASDTMMPTSSFDENLVRPMQPPALPREDVQSLDELPQIYTPTQIPLALLLKNYSLLLARKQDWKNIAIVFLVIASITLTLRPATVIVSPEHGLTSLNPATFRTVSAGVSSHFGGYEMEELTEGEMFLDYKDGREGDAESQSSPVSSTDAASEFTIEQVPAPVIHKDHNSSTENTYLRDSDIPGARGSPGICVWQFPFIDPGIAIGSV